MARRYRQYCGLARALELVGRRWNGLVVRELMLGPRRYSDLLEGLPSIGTSVLVRCLDDLQAEGLIERAELPMPVATPVYRLTEAGQALAEALVPLAAWGRRRLGKRRRDEALRPNWALLYLQSRFRPDVAAQVEDDLYELQIDDETFQLQIRMGRLEARQGPAKTEPSLRISLDLGTAAAIAAAESSGANAATMAGRVRFEGSAAARQRFSKLFGFA